MYYDVQNYASFFDVQVEIKRQQRVYFTTQVHSSGYKELQGSKKGASSVSKASVFQEFESASLLIRQLMFSRVMDTMMENDRISAFLRHDLYERLTFCFVEGMLY
jgi:hypothetical protein